MATKNGGSVVLKCRVPKCTEKHQYHYCRTCKTLDVSHFTRECGTNAQADADEADDEEIQTKPTQVDTSKKSKPKKREAPAVSDADDESASSKKKKKEEVLKTSSGKKIKAVGTGSMSLMLAQKYEAEDFSAIKGWLMSEKLDGVRCYWNGSMMYTRNGKLFYPPDWFKALLPSNLALDGELWTKRDDFQAGVSIVRCQDKNARDWSKITYMVYDAPLVHDKFSERLNIIKEVLHDNRSDTEKKHVKLHKHEVCTSAEQLDQEMERVLALNGEGLMLKDPKCEYITKRTPKLLKVKKFDDAEAEVIAHIPGTGRCSNMLGALRVKDKNGKIFKVGSGFDDKQRRKPPKIGSTITFKHQGVSKSGIPRFPIFLRVHPGV